VGSELESKARRSVVVRLTGAPSLAQNVRSERERR